jgi:hypothetical protein
VEDNISPTKMAEPRDAFAFAQWLRLTAKLLDEATTEVDSIDDLVKRFGDDAKSFPLIPCHVGD